MRIRLAAIAILISTSAFAGDCTSEPKDKWLSEDAMKSKIAALGYKFDLFKVDGTCYEIYGTNSKGKTVEVYFNPIDGAVFKEETQ